LSLKPTAKPDRHPEPVNLNDKQMATCLKIQKELIEVLAKHDSILLTDNSFKIIAVSITLLISNFLNHFGFKDSNGFMQDLSDNINRTYKDFIKQDNDSFVTFTHGKKTDEGHCN